MTALPTRGDDDGDGKGVTGMKWEVRGADRQSGTDRIDEGRLARTGHTADADAMGAPGGREQAGEQLLGELLVVRPGRFDEGDRSSERRSVGSLYSIDVGVEIDCRANCVSWSSSDAAASVTTVPGGKMAVAPASRS